MRKRAFASAAIVGIALVDAAPALAANVAPYSWTGFYIGANIGGWNTRADYSGGLVGSVSRSSVIGGFYGGYNYQFGNGPPLPALNSDWADTLSENIRPTVPITIGSRGLSIATLTSGQSIVTANLIVD